MWVYIVLILKYNVYFVVVFIETHFWSVKIWRIKSQVVALPTERNMIRLGLTVSTKSHWSSHWEQQLSADPCQRDTALSLSKSQHVGSSEDTQEHQTLFVLCGIDLRSWKIIFWYTQTSRHTYGLNVCAWKCFVLIISQKALHQILSTNLLLPLVYIKVQSRFLNCTQTFNF